MDVELVEVDEAYIEKMVGYEADCSDGRGSIKACHNVGDFVSVILEEYERAVAVYDKNCNEGKYAPSCFNLARLYALGKEPVKKSKGVERDLVKAEELFGLGCELGHFESCYHKGVMQYASIGDEIKVFRANKSRPNDSKEELDVAIRQKNKTAALAILDNNCLKNEEHKSCTFVASHYLNKANPDRDPSKAIPYLKVGCDKKEKPTICHTLAVLYNLGDKNVPKDSVEFEKYKKKLQTAIEEEKKRNLQFDS